MRKEKLDRFNIKLYSEMIPSELESLIFQKNIHAFGVLFAETPVGAAVWSESPDDSYGRLLSIFVRPEARRMGIGSFILDNITADMRKAQKEGMTFKYADTLDRTILTPFFNELGFETETRVEPVGRTTIIEAARSLKTLLGKVQETGEAVSRLSGKKKHAVVNWIESMSGESSASYMSGKPESFVVLKEDEVKSALLFSAETEDLLSLDYAVSSDPKSLLGLLATAVKTLAGSYSKDTVIEMLLTTDSGLGLYKKIFGEAENRYPVTECRQSFLNF